jgi:hypothetical protein
MRLYTLVRIQFSRTSFFRHNISVTLYNVYKGLTVFDVRYITQEKKDFPSEFESEKRVAVIYENYNSYCDDGVWLTYMPIYEE